jgi:hypothetical protein
MAAPVKEIKFLAVARRSDKALLCTRVHSTDKSYDYVANVQRVLTSPGWASVTTDKLSLDDGGNMFYMLIDEVRGGRAEAGGAQATGASPNWPQRTAFVLLPGPQTWWQRRRRRHRLETASPGRGPRPAAGCTGAARAEEAGGGRA